MKFARTFALLLPVLWPDLALGQSLVYQETFSKDHTPIAGGSEPVRVRWCLDGARVDFSGPGSFDRGALLADGPSIDPLLHVYVGDAGCHTVRLRFQYLQLEDAEVDLEFALSDTPRPNCIIATPWRATEMNAVGVAGGAVDVSIGLDEHQSVYFRFDHGRNEQPLWIDNLSIEVAGCPTVSPLQDPCAAVVRGFDASFDTPLGDNVRPAGFEEWNAASIAPHPQCGGGEAGVLAFGQSKSPPYATTHCIDTTGMSNAHLAIAYTKPLGVPGPSIEASIEGGPYIEIWRAESFPVLPDQNGRCFWDAVDLGEAGLLMVDSLRLRMVGMSQIPGLAFDHLSVNEGPPPLARVLQVMPQVTPEASRQRRLVLVAEGSPLLGQSLAFQVSGMVAGTEGAMLGASLARNEQPMGDGTLLIDLSPGILVLMDEMMPRERGTSAQWPTGDLNMVPSLQAFAGRSLFVQAMATEPHSKRISLSNGLHVIFGAGR